MERDKLHFKCHVPRLLQEISECAIGNNSGILKVPLNVFRTYLGLVAQEAIRINDPKLNILMCEMALYDGTPAELNKAIKQQKKILKQLNKG